MRDDDAVARAVRASAGALIGFAVHELNNRLAVMRETLGLLEDLAGAGAGGAPGTARAHAALDDQVGRALNIVRQLSAIGAALEAPGSGFDAGQVVRDLLGLAERWARQNSLRIEREVPGELPRAAGDPALFLCLAHRLLLKAAAGLAPGGTVVARASHAGETLRLSLGAAGRGPAAPAGPGAGDEIDAELARRLGGKLVDEGGEVRTIVLTAIR